MSFLGCPGMTETPLSPATSILLPSPRPLLPQSCTLHHLPNEPPAPKAFGGAQDKTRDVSKQLEEGKARYGEKLSEVFCSRPRK